MQLLRWWEDDHPSCVSKSSENLSAVNEGEMSKEAGERERLRLWDRSVSFPQHRGLPSPSCQKLLRSHSIKPSPGSIFTRGAFPGAGAQCSVLTPQSTSWGSDYKTVFISCALAALFIMKFQGKGCFMPILLQAEAQPQLNHAFRWPLTPLGDIGDS